jgi:hypothetical protein
MVPDIGMRKESRCSAHSETTITCPQSCVRGAGGLNFGSCLLQVSCAGPPLLINPWPAPMSDGQRSVFNSKTRPAMTDQNDDDVYDETTGDWRPASEMAAIAASAGSVEVRDAAGNVLADG